MRKSYFLRFFLLISLVFGLIGTNLAQGGVPTDPDPDNDGIPNSMDNCDNTAGPDYNNGCPVHEPETPPDSDGDGTADGLDRCPNEAGDGANAGCPPGQDGTNPEPTSQGTSLDPAPTEGDCVVSTNSSTAVNMREFPSTESAIIAVLSPNEWLNVIAVFSAPTELYNTAMADAPAPFLDMFPSSLDGTNETWYLVQKVNEPLTGWVAEGVIRLGGECEPFNMAEKKKGGKKDQQAYLVVTMSDVLISGVQRSDDEEEPEDGIVIISIIGVLIGMREAPDGGSSPIADYVLILDTLGDSSGDPIPTEDTALNFVNTDLLEEGCELTQDDSGRIVPTCEDGGLPAEMPICTHQELNEEGVFEEVCYKVEIPEGCVVDNSTAGRWHVSCEDTGEDGVQITPIGEEESIVDIFWYDDNTVGIGLLLPAVQKVREAAARSQ
jgi:hypothetical protein